MRYSPSFYQSAKRRLQTKKCELQLQRVLKSHSPSEACMKAAEQLRAAKLAEMKAKEAPADFPSNEPAKRRLAATAAERSKWLNISLEEIVAHYKN